MGSPGKSLRLSPFSKRASTKMKMAFCVSLLRLSALSEEVTGLKEKD